MTQPTFRVILEATPAGFLLTREVQNRLGCWRQTSVTSYPTFPAFQLGNVPASCQLLVKAVR